MILGDHLSLSTPAAIESANSKINFGNARVPGTCQVLGGGSWQKSRGRRRRARTIGSSLKTASGGGLGGRDSDGGGAKEACLLSRTLAEYERVRNALRSLQSISSKPWSVERNRVQKLQERLTADDRKLFPMMAEVDLESYVLCAAAASRKYCVQDDLRFVKIIRLAFLFAPAMLVVAYIAFCSWYTSKVR